MLFMAGAWSEPSLILFSTFLGWPGAPMGGTPRSGEFLPLVDLLLRSIWLRLCALVYSMLSPRSGKTEESSGLTFPSASRKNLDSSAPFLVSKMGRLRERCWFLTVIIEFWEY